MLTHKDSLTIHSWNPIHIFYSHKNSWNECPIYWQPLCFYSASSVRKYFCTCSRTVSLCDRNRINCLCSHASSTLLQWFFLSFFFRPCSDAHCNSTPNRDKANRATTTSKVVPLNIELKELLNNDWAQSNWIYVPIYYTFVTWSKINNSRSAWYSYIVRILLFFHMDTADFWMIFHMYEFSTV